MITITEGMTPAQFVTAFNSNFEELLYDEVVLTEITTNTSVSDFVSISNINFTNLNIKTPITSSVNAFSIGMKGVLFGNYINNNFLSINNSFNVKVDRPILTLRFDDGYNKCKTVWLPLLNSLGVTGVVAILTGEIGNSVNYLTWEQVHDLEDAGWEISAHGDLYTNTDFSALSDDQIYTLLKGCKDAIIAQGINCENYMPHSTNAFHVPYIERISPIAKKLFKMDSIGSFLTEGLTPNPINLNLFQITSWFGDYPLSGYHDIDTDEGVSEVKAMLDIVKNENRWLVFANHSISASDTDRIAGNTEVINYAKSLGITIATMKEVYDNYLVPQ